MFLAISNARWKCSIASRCRPLVVMASPVTGLHQLFKFEHFRRLGEILLRRNFEARRIGRALVYLQGFPFLPNLMKDEGRLPAGDPVEVKQKTRHFLAAVAHQLSQFLDQELLETLLGFKDGDRRSDRAWSAHAIEMQPLPTIQVFPLGRTKCGSWIVQLIELPKSWAVSATQPARPFWCAAGAEHIED